MLKWLVLLEFLSELSGKKKETKQKTDSIMTVFVWPFAALEREVLIFPKIFSQTLEFWLSGK